MTEPARLWTRPLLAGSLALSCAACGGGKGTPSPASAAPPPAVTVATPQVAPVTEAIELDGVVAPSASVNLMARVSGVLESASFHDGDAVHAGQLLFVIEPAPYREQVKLNQAKLDQARSDAERQQALLAENATSQSSVENSASQLKQAEANLALARINLGYTEVRAPFDGVIGRRLVDVGNVVGAAPGGTVLTTITRLRPVDVNFALNERDLLRLRALAAAGRARPGMNPYEKAKSAVGKLPVRATLQDGGTPEFGVLDFIDNGLSANTGSIQLRARFANEGLRLVPGLYAKVRIELGTPHRAILLTNAVVQADQRGSFVYVVGDDHIAKRRDIETGDAYGTQREVRHGLAAGERVIVNGMSNVRDGQAVTVENVEAPVRAEGVSSPEPVAGASSPAPVAGTLASAAASTAR